MTVNVPAASLIEDLSFYPRNQVDDTHVNELVKALASGSTLPPIIVEESSKRIVDGVHRHRALMKFNGDDTEVAVEYRTYSDDAALYIDAVKLNAQHGRRLDRHDQTRIVLRLQELKVDARTIASALHVPEQEVRTLAVRIVYDTGGTAVPQKRGLEHLRGQTLSDEQIAAMKSVRSAEAGRLCIELIKLLDNELIDYDDTNVRDRLQQLAHAVAGALKRIRQFAKKQNDKDAVPA
jgi:hypothetical protein